MAHFMEMLDYYYRLEKAELEGDLLKDPLPEGHDADTRARIFSMITNIDDNVGRLFQRLDAQEEYGGTGIGLAICKKIVERHGGEITATSELGKGSMFVVTLPAEIKKGQHRIC